MNIQGLFQGGLGGAKGITLSPLKFGVSQILIDYKMKLILKIGDNIQCMSSYGYQISTQIQYHLTPWLSCPGATCTYTCSSTWAKILSKSHSYM